MIVTIALRLILGGVLAAGLVMWGVIDFPYSVIFVLVVASISAVWGDKFILGFMSAMRYLR